jgi:hypothetical protein
MKIYNVMSQTGFKNKTFFEVTIHLLINLVLNINLLDGRGRSNDVRPIV